MPFAITPPQYDAPQFPNHAQVEAQPPSDARLEAQAPSRAPFEALTTLAAGHMELTTPTVFDTITSSEGRPTAALGDQQAQETLPQIVEQVRKGLITATEEPGVYTTRTGDRYSIVTVAVRNGRLVDVPVSENDLEAPSTEQHYFIEKQGPNLVSGENALERFYTQYGERIPNILIVDESATPQIKEFAQQIANTGEATINLDVQEEVTDTDDLIAWFGDQLGLTHDSISDIGQGYYGGERALNYGATMLVQLPGEEIPRLLVVNIKRGDPDSNYLKVDPSTNEVYEAAHTIQLSAVEAQSTADIGTTLVQARQLNGVSADYNLIYEQIVRKELNTNGTYAEQDLTEMDMTKFSGSPVLRRFYRMMGLNYKDFEETHSRLAELGTKFFTTREEDNVTYGIKIPITEANHQEEGGVHIISIQLEGRTVTIPMAHTGDVYFDAGKLTNEAELVIERRTDNFGEFYWKAVVSDSNSTGRAPFHAPNERLTVLRSNQPPEVTNNNEPGEKPRRTLQMRIADIFNSDIPIGPNENSLLHNLEDVPHLVEALTYLKAYYGFGRDPEVVVPIGDIENPEITVSKATHASGEDGHSIDIVIRTPYGQIRLIGENEDGFPEDIGTREIQKLSLSDFGNNTGAYLMKITWADDSYTFVGNTGIGVFWTGLANGPTWSPTYREETTSPQQVTEASNQVPNTIGRNSQYKRYPSPPSRSRTDYTAGQVTTRRR